MKLLHTIEFEPTAVGTTIQFRFAPPTTPRKVELMTEIGPAHGQALQAGIPSLTEQLDTAMAAREIGGGPEPELPNSTPGGLLS